MRVAALVFVFVRPKLWPSGFWDSQSGGPDSLFWDGVSHPTVPVDCCFYRRDGTEPFPLCLSAVFGSAVQERVLLLLQIL